MLLVVETFKTVWLYHGGGCCRGVLVAAAVDGGVLQLAGAVVVVVEVMLRLMLFLECVRRFLLLKEW